MEWYNNHFGWHVKYPTIGIANGFGAEKWLKKHFSWFACRLHLHSSLLVHTRADYAKDIETINFHLRFRWKVMTFDFICNEFAL